MKVLRQIGVEERLRDGVFEPKSHLNLEWNTGKVLRELPMPEELFGAPYLCMHRADLTAALVSVVPKEIIHFKKKLVELRHQAGGVELTFGDGTQCQADAVVGADGVHSVVREIIVGPDEPIHKGRIAYRAVFSAELLNGRDLGPSRVKWWGVDRHIVIYYVTKDRSQIYFVTSVPESAEWLTVAQNAGENENFGQDSIDGILACNTEANNVNVDDRTQMTELELQHGTAWDSIRLLGSKQRKVNGSHGIIYQTGLESIPGAGEASLLTRTSLREDCLQQN